MAKKEYSIPEMELVNLAPVKPIADASAPELPDDEL